MNEAPFFRSVDQLSGDTVQDRIANVLREHRTQGWNVTESAPMCSCGDTGEYMAHAAEVIAVELGFTEATK